MLDVLYRSHRGRVCEYKREDASIRTPFIIGTSGHPDPLCPACISLSDEGRVLHLAGAEIPLDGGLMTTASSGEHRDPECVSGVCVMRMPFPDEAEIPEDAEMLLVPNAYELRRDPRKLVDAVMRIRDMAGPNRLVCMLGIAEPSTLALLTYMGVDVFDASLPAAMGITGVSLVPEGEILSGGDRSEQNSEELVRECSKVTVFTEAGRLRELVDQRAPSSPSSVAILRIFDRAGYAYQEEACPTVGGRFACNTTQSLRRPDVARYRDRVSEHYRKPSHKRILLLLPCSAKKPYHTSKSHKAFSSAIHTAGHDTIVHEVIVTSPLGIVPRELDVFYPANSYDIPVTGEWKCEEKEMIRGMTAKLLEQGYDKVISHLGESTELVRGLADMEETCVGDPTSPASLAKLDAALRAAAEGMPCGDYMVDRMETVRSVLSFQFGPEAADLLMSGGAYAIGKFPYWKLLLDKSTQLGMMSPERGMFSLTLEGANLLAPRGISTVEMTDFEMKGNLFAVGVRDADLSIRQGDEAIVVLDGAVKGVGVAMMSGREMKELKRGIAVKIRHKAK
ncbi:MAG: DUF5591 domain-containing protein [Candidatus Methanomethylophilaceae archaeon]|jgi:archaeosine synthase|nr:DUF5591 domain-containing protein [Candidatus Methanomethylophilaceae archaeon]NLF33630.1 DUF5591 domain-containing protein [Thermoplasmatales archaeon]